MRLGCTSGVNVMTRKYKKEGSSSSKIDSPSYMQQKNLLESENLSVRHCVIQKLCYLVANGDNCVPYEEGGMIYDMDFFLLVMSRFSISRLSRIPGGTGRGTEGHGSFGSNQVIVT